MPSPTRKHPIPIKVNQIDHHRNGIFGESFYVVHFTATGNRMLAVVFSPFDEHGDVDWAIFEHQRELHEPRVAVFEAAQLPDTTFAENSWRGDEYAPALYAALAEHEALPYAAACAAEMARRSGK